MKAHVIAIKHIQGQDNSYNSMTNNIITAEAFIDSPSIKFHLGLHWLCFYYIKKGK